MTASSLETKSTFGSPLPRAGTGSTPSSKRVVFEIDDLCDRFDPLNDLITLKKRFPNFRVTIFAIPMLCSEGLLKRYREHSWIRLEIHGYNHSTCECFDWTMLDAVGRLEHALEVIPEATGFKAPGWIAGDGLYCGLREKGLWVADHAGHSNQWLEHTDLGRYVYQLADNVTAMHGHTWDTMGNGPADWTDMFKDVEPTADFAFVAEAIEDWSSFDLGQEMGSSWSHNSVFGERAAVRLADFLEKEQPKGVVADFGGNDGWAAACCFDANLGNVEVVDGSPARVAFARNVLKITAHLTHFEKMPFEDNHFDWGFTSHTLEHLENMEECWAEMKRVCKTGIWVVVPVESDEFFEANKEHHRQYSHNEWLSVLGCEPVERLKDELICKCVF